LIQHVINTLKAGVPETEAQEAAKALSTNPENIAQPAMTSSQQFNIIYIMRS
jgi:hypothetical protein